MTRRSFFSKAFGAMAVAPLAAVAPFCIFKSEGDLVRADWHYYCPIDGWKFQNATARISKIRSDVFKYTVLHDGKVMYGRFEGYSTPICWNDYFQMPRLTLWCNWSNKAAFLR